MPLTLVNKEHLTDNIWAFRFSSSEPLNWVAGQYVQVELPHDNPDAEGTKRWFTDSAAPYQGILQITTRITNSMFKQALANLPVGGELQLIAQPDGDFIWQDSDKPLILVAGGIGVTPYYSMLKQRVHDQLPIQATLIYGSRSEDIPFRAELDEWARANSDFHVQYAVGAPLTAATLSALAPTVNDSLVYLSGPEPMVEALGDDLKAHGLPEAQQTDRQPGARCALAAQPAGRLGASRRRLVVE
jgi:ferredoxin-NADP reductase